MSPSFTEKGLIGLSDCWSMCKLACNGPIKAGVLSSSNYTRLEKDRRRLSGVGTTPSSMMTVVSHSRSLYRDVQSGSLLGSELWMSIEQLHQRLGQYQL